MPLYSASESEGLYFGNFCTKAIAAILLLFFISMSVHACMIYGTIQPSSTVEGKVPFKSLAGQSKTMNMVPYKAHGWDGTRTKMLVDTTLTTGQDPMKFCEFFNSINMKENGRMAVTRFAVFWTDTKTKKKTFKTIKTLQNCVYNQKTKAMYIQMDSRTAQFYDFLTHPNLYKPKGANVLDKIVAQDLRLKGIDYNNPTMQVTPIQLVYKSFAPMCNITKIPNLYTKFISESYHFNTEYSRALFTKDSPIITPFEMTALDGMSTDMCHLPEAKTHTKVLFQRNMVRHPSKQGMWDAIKMNLPDYLFYYNGDFSNIFGQNKVAKRPSQYIIFEARVQEDRVSQDFLAYRGAESTVATARNVPMMMMAPHIVDLSEIAFKLGGLWAFVLLVMALLNHCCLRHRVLIH